MDFHNYVGYASLKPNLCVQNLVCGIYVSPEPLQITETTFVGIHTWSTTEIPTDFTHWVSRGAGIGRAEGRGWAFPVSCGLDKMLKMALHTTGPGISRHMFPDCAGWYFDLHAAHSWSGRRNRIAESGRLVARLEKPAAVELRKEIHDVEFNAWFRRWMIPANA